MTRFQELPPILRRAAESWLQRSFLTTATESPQDREGLLEQEKSYNAPSTTNNWQAIKNVRVRCYLPFVGIALIVSFLLSWAFQVRSQAHAATLIRERNAQTLHLLIPTPNLPTELCQTVLSAAVLHYSTPTLVRWDAVTENPRMNAQSRMTAVRNHLGKIREHNESDTVILLDSVSSWFQLRPEVLLDRYYKINRRADDRLASSIGVDVMEVEGIRQSVVFAASATCGITSGTNETDCSHFPESPLTAASFETNAPRYLDQALVIGTAKSVHEVYRRAVAVIERADGFESEQAILTEILNSQERHRQSLTPKTQTWTERFRGWFSGKYAHGPLASKNMTTNHPPKRHANEFGIGLDYAGELSFATTDEAESFVWKQHDNDAIASDIAASMPPFWTTSGQRMPTDKTWSDVDLLMNKYTNVIPAAIQHNITSTNSGLRAKLWKKFWLSVQSRELFDAHVMIPAMPLAALVDNEGIEQVFWSTTIGNKAGVKISDGSWLGWKDLCRGDKLADEVFGDGLGEWKSKLP